MEMEHGNRESTVKFKNHHREVTRGDNRKKTERDGTDIDDREEEKKIVEEGAIVRAPCSAIVQSPAFPPEKVIDTLDAGDTFNAAVIYYLNKSKVEFMRKYKEKTASMSDANQTKDNVSDNGTAVKRDIEENLNPENLGYDRLKFITETVLQKAIKIGCRIAGAKVGLRGYDNLDVMSSDIL